VGFGIGNWKTEEKEGGVMSWYEVSTPTGERLVIQATNQQEAALIYMKMYTVIDITAVTERVCEYEDPHDLGRIRRRWTYNGYTNRGGAMTLVTDCVTVKPVTLRMIPKETDGHDGL